MCVLRVQCVHIYLLNIYEHIVHVTHTYSYIYIIIISYIYIINIYEHIVHVTHTYSYIYINTHICIY